MANDEMTCICQSKFCFPMKILITLVKCLTCFFFFTGSVAVEVAILIGFYGVIWAQVKEEKDEMDKVDRLQCSYL